MERLHFGKDGVVRAVDLRTSKGRKTRAIQRLHNLEITENDLAEEEVVDDVGVVDVDSGGVLSDSTAVDSRVDDVSSGVVSDSAAADSRTVDLDSSGGDSTGVGVGVGGTDFDGAEVEVDGEVEDCEEEEQEKVSEVDSTRRRKLPSKFKDFVIY